MTATDNTLVLAVNAGSATLKFALYSVHADAPADQPNALASAPVASGQFDGMAGPGPLRLSGRDAQQRPIQAELAAPANAGNPGDASIDAHTASRFELALQHLQGILASLLPPGSRLVAVAHRIVHGGDRCQASQVLDADTISYLTTLCELAPLHQPHNLRGLRAFAAAFPNLPQVGCFDTGFHATLPALERRLPLPAALQAQGVQRYGFHGLSYRWLMQQLGDCEASLAGGRWLLAHLGSGASLCAVQRGQSVATTMGFSALDGLMMGSRSGALDPGVLLYLLRQGWTADRLERLLYKECGLLGVSGLSADMRTLRANATPAATEAIRLFEHSIVRQAGAMVACLGGLDGLVFTGGIGENDALLRAAVCQGLGFLGLTIDPVANSHTAETAARRINTKGSLPVWVIPTDEGRVAAQDAARLI